MKLSQQEPPDMWFATKNTDANKWKLPFLRRRHVSPEVPLKFTIALTPFQPIVKPRIVEAYPTSVKALYLSPICTPDKVIKISFAESSLDKPETKNANEKHYHARTSQTNNLGINSVASEQEGLSLAERLRILLSVPIETLLPGAGTILYWPSDLMDFQKQGVQTLINKNHILLADDMGLGKTLQVIAALRLLIIKRTIKTVLIIVPASLLNQWRREIEKWAPEVSAMKIQGNPSTRAWQWQAENHIKLISYETLRADFSDNEYSPVRRQIWDVVVADEAQRIKNRNSTSVALKNLQRLRSWALSGTPIENNEDELASILEFVDHDSLISDKRFTAGDELQNRHKQLQLRRRKKDVLSDLPPKLINHVSLEMGSSQRNSYVKAEQDGIVHLKELGTDVRIQHVLELITRLKQICNADPYTEESIKFDDIKRRIEELSQQGHRALIFSQYTDETYGVLAAKKTLERFNPLTLTGNMSSTQRDNVIQQFKNNDNHKLLILSLRAGGIGLNLQEASYVFHLDRWWNPATENQAEDRTHRFGQTARVNVIKYTCADTIEEKIHKILESKQDLFDKLIDDVSMDISTHMDASDLFGLFGLPAPLDQQTRRPQQNNGLELEERCTTILSERGYSVHNTPRTGDGGIDVIGYRTDELGQSHKVYIQCKDHARPVGVTVIRELLGSIPTENNITPILASPKGVTSEAQKTATERNVIIWDETELYKLENTVRGHGIGNI